MRGKTQILSSLPTLNERELTLVWRDVHRAADAAAIGGASEGEWYNYLDVERAIEHECGRRFGTKPTDYLNREGADELPQIYARIFKRRKKESETK